MAEIFFRSRGENYPLKNSKLDCLGGIFSGLKTILSKIVKNTTIWLSFFTFVGVKNGPFCQIFSGLIITTMSSKITNLTTIWPSFFSGLDVKNGLSWEKHLWNGLFGKILVWNSKSWFLQIIYQKFGQRWSFFRLLKIIMNYFWIIWVFFDYHESWRFASRGAPPPLTPRCCAGP